MKKAVFLIMALGICAANLHAEEGQIMSAQQIKKTIKNYVIKSVGCSEGDLMMQYKSPLVDEKLPAGKVDLEIKTGANPKFIGFTPVEVFILLDNKIIKNFLVYLEIDIKTKAYMANRWIKRYEPLSPDNLILVETYRSRVPLDAIPAETDLSGKVTKIALAKGRIITRSIIDSPPLIRRSDLVNVILKSGNLEVTAKAAALMDAKKDDTIKLRLLDSKKEIYGKVVDASTVLVGTEK